MTDFVIADVHTAASDGAAYGGPLASDTLARIAAALEIQANRDFASAWGGTYRWRVATAAAPPLATEVVAMLVDVLPPGDAGAAAFHTWTGIPQIYVAKTQCNSLLVGPDALSTLFSHEGNEAELDPGCNRWADAPDGFSYALEASDAVESSTYDVAGVSVANFVLPAFFNPSDVGPYDYGTTIGRPAGVSASFATAPGGYQVRRPTAGGEAQIWGAIRPHMLAKKRHPSSRTSRRGVRF